MSRATPPDLFSSVTVGALTLPNRAMMAPLTRSRAGAGNVPSSMAPEYYSQRAGAGLIITEATQATADGQGYIDTPGLFNAEQVAGWKKVTDAVHAKGGRIYLQIWHGGRACHSALNGGAQTSRWAGHGNGARQLVGAGG